MIQLCAYRLKSLQETNYKELGLVKENIYRWEKDREKCKSARETESNRMKESCTSKGGKKRVNTTPVWFFIATLQQWSRVFFSFPQDDGGGSAVSWHWWRRTTRLAYSSQWSGSSWWISLSGAVGIGGGCCRRTGCFLETPEFHLVSGSSLHLMSPPSHPVWGTQAKSRSLWQEN